MPKINYKSDIKLQEKYKDTITGFEGTATAIYFYMNGCERVTLEAWFESKGELRELTFDAPRLMHVKSGKVATTDRTGGFKPTPPRQGTA